MADCVFCSATLTDSDRCGACRRGQPVESMQGPPGLAKERGAAVSAKPVPPVSDKEPIPGGAAFGIGLVFLLVGNVLGPVFWPLALLAIAGWILLAVAAMTFASAVWQRLPAPH